MGKLFADRGLCARGNLLPAAEFHLFADCGFDLEKMFVLHGADLIAMAEKDLDKPYPMLSATLYMEFARNGNRSHFEDVYFRRRDMLLRFALAELAEKQGRFTDRIVDGVWHILEESTWILPAHNRSGKKNSHVPLCDVFLTAEEGDDVKFIDLFAATTAGMMAMIWALCEDILDSQTPVIRRRILSQLRQRILHPFYTYDDNWWMGGGTRKLNNWSPWIVSNVLLVIALCEQDDSQREIGVEKCMLILDRFIKDYPEDGGCDEGPGYWNKAGASYFDCLELLYDLSGGKIDVFDEPLISRMCEYIMDFSITGNTYINFADASARLHPDYRMIHRMGRRLDSPVLRSFAVGLAEENKPIPLDGWSNYRFFKNLLETLSEADPFVPREKIWYDGLQVAITRDVDSGLFLAMKGGCNGESHNHNDVGHFILFRGDDPIFLDAGVETYSRDTFSARRYTLWPMRSSYHNMAEIRGIEQKPGAEYCAEVIEYSESTGALTLELKNAYPSETKIDSYRRTAVLQEGTAVITDVFRLREPGTVELHYLTPDKPEFGEGTIRLGRGHVASFDPSLTASVEEIDLQGGKIAGEWQRASLWRICLATAEPITEGAFTLTVSK